MQRPMADTLVKICGLSTAETLEAAIEAGADMAGFVFFEKSPRHLSHDAARGLGEIAAGRIAKVALCVDAGDDALGAIVESLAPDYLQLHGGETPERVAAIQARFRLPVIKAIGVAGAQDVETAKQYGAEIILFDAKPAPDAAAPGGAGVAFDWSLLRNIGAANWMLSGGLDPDNVATAIEAAGARAVDVSSGVERRRGVKDVGLIRAFMRAARRKAD